MYFVIASLKNVIVADGTIITDSYIEDSLIGKNLKDIPENAFQNCTALASIEMANTIETIEKDSYIPYEQFLENEKLIND